MGRNFASATELVRQVNTDLMRFGEMLPPQDRVILNRFAEHGLNNRAAIANAANLMPLEVMLLLNLLDEHKTNQRVQDELRAEIERLKALSGSAGPGG